MTQTSKQTLISNFSSTISKYEQKNLAELLETHNITPSQFKNIVINEVKKSEQMQQAFLHNPASLFASILLCAELGLNPSADVGEFYFLPFGKKITPILGYKGLISLLLRSGEIAKLWTEIVYEEDDFEFSEPEPAVDNDFDTGDLTGLAKENAVDEVDANIPEVNVAVDYDATMTLVDAGDMAEEFSVPTVNPIEVGAVVPTEVGFPEEPAFDALADDGYASGGYQTQSGPQPTLASFKGKKDRSDQWSTKWLYIGFGILGTLLIGVAVLWFVNIGQKPEDMFEAAMSSFNKQSYGDAQKKFDNYLDQYATHKDAPKAKVKRIHAIIRGTYGLKNYTEVMKQSETLLTELREQEDATSEMEELRDDLAVMLPTSLAAISKKAIKVTDLDKMKEELVKVKDFYIAWICRFCRRMTKRDYWIRWSSQRMTVVTLAKD